MTSALPVQSAKSRRRQMHRVECANAPGTEALLRESLAVRRSVFGEAHPEYAITLNNLASTVEAHS